MPDALAARAEQLYAGAIVWDDHAGFAPDPAADLSKLAIWRQAGVTYLSINVGFDVMRWDDTIKVLAAFRRWIAAHPDEYRLVGNVEQIRQAKRDGRLAVTFDIEGMNALDGAVDMVSLYYDLGVRQMLFAYNRNNLAGGGCHDADVGLTPFGRAVIAEMNRVGMLVDCSHSGYRTTMEAMEFSTAPVIFSHSNPRGRWDHGRNIRDEQIKACAAGGGVIGINGVGIFLGANDTRTELLADHVDYVADLVGARHIGIGLDYAFEVMADGLDALLAAHPDYWPAGNRYDTPRIGIAAPAQLRELADLLLRRGYADDDLRGILGGNFLRIAGEIWK
jgi:membrane dipeptidase